MTGTPAKRLVAPGASSSVTESPRAEARSAEIDMRYWEAYLANQGRRNSFIDVLNSL